MLLLQLYFAVSLIAQAPLTLSGAGKLPTLLFMLMLSLLAIRYLLVAMLFTAHVCLFQACKAAGLLQKAARHAGNDEKRRARASPSASASQCAGRAPSSSPSPGYIDHSEPAKGVVQPGVFGEGEGGQGRAAAAGPARGSGRRKGKGRSRGRGRAMRTWGHDGFKQLYGRSGLVFQRHMPMLSVHAV